MQEIHSIGRGTRFFAAASGDRRLRPHIHNTDHHHQQPLNCPRCDSINTKFCYYNNYNLSQPRHFCKNCRRYWTKGGVLRNVPVGGGCRKSKRSSNSKTKTATSTSETTSSQQQPPEQKSNSHSSSESSSLTASTTAAVTELNSGSSNDNLHDSKFLTPSSNPGLESGGGAPLEQGAGDCNGIFSEIGTFSSLIASSSSNNDALASFGFGAGGVTDAASFQWPNQKLNDSLSGSGGTLLDHHGHGSASVTVDLSALQGKTANAGFGPLDWQGGADQGLFDLPNAVDQAYWSHSQWHDDQDNSTLFHLP